MTNVRQKFFIVSYFIYFYSIKITLKEMAFVYRKLMMHLFIYKFHVSKIEETNLYSKNTNDIMNFWPFK